MKKFRYSKFIFLIIFFQLFSCTSNYGEKIEYTGDDELYYTNNVTEWEANKLGNFLTQNFFFTGRGITSQLDKANDKFQFRFVVLEGAHNDDDYVKICEDFAIELSDNVFNKSNVEIHLCDKYLKTLRIVSLNKVQTNNKTEPTKWVSILDLSGKGDKKSSPFSIIDKPVRIKYSFNTEWSSMGIFMVYVMKEGMSFEEDGGIVEVSVEGIDSGLSRLYKKPGRYYLSVRSVNGSWEIAIEEGVYQE